MTQNKFLISDPHFSHQGVCEFLRSDGSKLRPWDNVEEMDEALVKNWNETVKPTDKVYVLGDVVFHNKHLPIIGRLNGTKILIKGNHDQLKLSAYAQYFKDVRACHHIDNYLMTHIPIHPQSLKRWKGNFHGHLHADVIVNSIGDLDPNYFNVSVECINYRPIEWSEAVRHLETMRSWIHVDY